MRYLDHNATSPVCGSARQAWLEAVERWPGNPSSPHRMGGRAEHALDEARAEFAAILGCAPTDLIWTSGATESVNTVLHHLSHESTGEAWVSAVEHPCVHAAARRWFPGRHRPLPVTGQGVLELSSLANELERQRPAVVVLMAANNETGVLQPWPEAAALCRSFGVPFFCDAAQWLGKLPAAGLGPCEFVTGCAHKFGGVPGVGFLKVPGRIRPLLVGGSQEEGQRAGTENLPGIRACVAALRERESELNQRGPEQRAVDRDGFEARVLAEVPGAEGVGRFALRLWNTSAVLLPVADCRRRWVVQLDRAGFAVSTGSACSSGKEKPSHVLEAMGIDGRGERLIRVSSGWDTKAGDWEALAAAITRIARE